mgnify:CR=1 FL=1
MFLEVSSILYVFGNNINLVSSYSPLIFSIKILYSSISGAASYKQTGISSKHAVNSINTYISNHIAKRKSGEWESKGYKRNFDLPQTAVSLVFFNYILKIGNKGFEEVPKIEQNENVAPAVVEVNEAEEQNIVQDTITETSVVPVVKAEQAPKKTQTKIDDNFYNRNFYDSKITIHTGETLVINGNKYVVKKSDDISKIAKDNKVSVKAIVIENYWLVENNRVKFK